MRRTLSVLLLLSFLTACTGAPAEVPPTAPPPTLAAREPTAAPPTAAPPTSAPPTAAPPTAVPPTSAPPTPAAPPIVLDTPLDPAAQAAALLPEFAGDLDRAGEWNRYRIVATVNPNARTLVGQLRLDYTNRDVVPLDRLYLHLYPNLPEFGGQLDVRRLSVDGRSIEAAYEERRYLLRVDLPQPLAPGAQASLLLEWTVSAPENASERLYGAFNKEAGVFALASAYPIMAIVRNGQWDIARPDARGDFVNSETALYEVALTAPSDWRVVTTGVAAERNEHAGQQTLRLVSGPQRDFMIALTQLEIASAEVEGTHINSYYQRGSVVGGEAALRAAEESLRAFNKRYGRYPLRELDVIQLAASTFLGVEYPGFIAIEQRLYDNSDGLAITVAHEVGHQWWYSLVGNNVQNSAWLDEALASYSQIVYREEVQGPAAAEAELEGFRRRYQKVLADGLDAPAQQPNTAFRGNYVLLVYGKAVLFFQALRRQIGEEAFDRFLHEYYAEHRYGYVAGDNLLATAERSCGCELDTLYADWITRAVPLELP